MRHFLLISILLLFCLPQVAVGQQASIRRCTPEDLTYKEREYFIGPIMTYIEQYYSDLLYTVSNPEVQDYFMSWHMVADSVRYMPEFLTDDSGDNDFLRPDGYLMELDRAFDSLNILDYQFTVSNFHIDRDDFFKPSLISCCVIADYDLELTGPKGRIFLRRCRAYILFPRAQIISNRRLLQVEPLAPVQTSPDGNNDKPTVSDMDADYERADALYEAGNYQEAVSILQRLEIQEHPKALNLLGSCHVLGRGVTQNSVKANSLYLKSAELGYVRGMTNIAESYMEGGGGIVRDYKIGAEWYAKAAEKGDTIGQVKLGLCYVFGQGVPKDEKRAYALFLKSAEQGFDWAQACIGHCYSNGIGVSRDLEEAERWYRKSIHNGWTDALNEYGDFLLEQEKYGEAYRMYSRAAKQNDAYGLANVGYCHEFGYGVAKDYNKAMQYYLEAADKGNDFAENRIGEMYYCGRGFPQNFHKSFEWFRKAAEHGNISAFLQVGYAYHTANGTEKNQKLAYEWFLKAAEAGDRIGQYKLGVFYQKGIYVSKDLEKARYWYGLSAKQDYKDAIKALERLNSGKDYTGAIKLSVSTRLKGQVRMLDKTGTLIPVNNVDVIVEGRSVSTFTDENGHFSLTSKKIRKGDFIRFVKTGMKTVYRKWDGSSKMDVTMEPVDR